MDNVSAAGEHVLGGVRVLVVDDSDATRAVLGGILRKFGAEVFEAASGAEAIGQVKSMPIPFDVILLDMVMNEMDGLETAERIFDRLPNGKACIIPMGASIGTHTRERLNESGIEAQPLHKPYSPAQVVQSVLAVMCGKMETEEPPEALSSDVTSAPQLPRIPGIDVRGALERCLDDLGLLRRIVLDCQSNSRAALFRAQEAVHASDLKGAHHVLHKLRGELLNLGMVELVEVLIAIQSRIDEFADEVPKAAPATSMVRTQPLRLFQFRSLLANDIQVLSYRLDEQLIRYLSLPALRRPSQITVARQQDIEGDVDPAAFENLLIELQQRNVKALKRAHTPARVIPQRYSKSEEQLFLRHLEALDFERALALLQPADVPAVGDTSERDQHRILLVDRAPLTIRLLANILAELGEIRFAKTAAEAAAIAANWRPDLLLVNVDLDEASGIDLCRTLKSSEVVRHSLVILMSSNNDAMTEILGLTAGAVDFIEMPIMPARVLGRIRGHLRTSRLAAPTSAHSRPEQGIERVSGYLVCDVAGKLIALSPDFARFLGGEKQYLGEQVTAMFRGSDAQRMSKLHADSAELGLSDSQRIYITSIAGDKLPLRASGRKVTCESGVVIWISCESDVDMVLEYAQETHKEVSKVLATVSGGIAHEFNNQLSVIIGNIDLSLEVSSLSEAFKPLQRARDAALRLATTTRSMGEASIRRAQPVGMPEKVDHLIERYWGVWKSMVPGNIVFRHLPGDKDCWVRMASDDFRWIMAALIQNAVEAMPNGGNLTVHCHLAPSQHPLRKGCNDVTIDVADDGVGMNAMTLAKARQPFFTTKPDHAGLGLNQVAWGIDELEGGLDVASSAGGGCIVSLRLPVAQA